MHKLVSLVILKPVWILLPGIVTLFFFKKNKTTLKTFSLLNICLWCRTDQQITQNPKREKRPFGWKSRMYYCVKGRWRRFKTFSRCCMRFELDTISDLLLLETQRCAHVDSSSWLRQTGPGGLRRGPKGLLLACSSQTASPLLRWFRSDQTASWCLQEKPGATCDLPVFLFPGHHRES